MAFSPLVLSADLSAFVPPQQPEAVRAHFRHNAVKQGLPLAPIKDSQRLGRKEKDGRD